MKYLVLFFVVAGLVAVASGLYAVGAMIFVLIALFYAAVFYLVMEFSELYFRMPTVWQNVPETLEVAKTNWFLNHGVNFGSASGLYRMMQSLDSLFDVKIDEQVIAAFEQKYDDMCVVNARAYLPKQRALYYFIMSRQYYPERLPDVVNAIMVRKKVGGKRVEGRASVFFKVAFN